MEAPPPKKAKTSPVLTLGALEQITHRTLHSAANPTDPLKLIIESGSANSIFNVQQIDLANIIRDENERSIRCPSD